MLLENSALLHGACCSFYDFAEPVYVPTFSDTEFLYTVPCDDYLRQYVGFLTEKKIDEQRRDVAFDDTGSAVFGRLVTDSDSTLMVMVMVIVLLIHIIRSYIIHCILSLRSRDDFAADHPGLLFPSR